MKKFVFSIAVITAAIAFGKEAKADSSIYPGRASTNDTGPGTVTTTCFGTDNECLIMWTDSHGYTRFRPYDRPKEVYYLVASSEYSPTMPENERNDLLQAGVPLEGYLVTDDN